jgi:hypothetical protein
MNELVVRFSRAALLAIVRARRYSPGHHQHHNGFLRHVFATSPWLGAIVVAVIVLAGLMLAVIKKAGRILEGTPWYVRLALLVTAGLGIFRLLSQKKQAMPEGIPHPPDGWQPTGPDREPVRRPHREPGTGQDCP